MEEGKNDPRIRTMDVTLQGGAPWGFTLKGGSELRRPLTVARIDPGGKASQSGALQVDDIILSINNVECEAHTEAIQLVKGSPNTLDLIIQRMYSEETEKGRMERRSRPVARSVSLVSSGHRLAYPWQRSNRSGSDFHLPPHQTMKQTDYHRPHQYRDVSPREVKSQSIYDMGPSPPPQSYEKSGNIYCAPNPKVAVGGGVTRRLKRGESTNQRRPKSWHSADPSHEQPILVKTSKPVVQPTPRPPQQSPSHQTPRLDPSPSMDSLTTLQTFHKIHGKTLPRSNSSAKSMSNLQGFQNDADIHVGPGFVKGRVSDLSSSTSELSSCGKDKDFYFKGPITPYNPRFRKVDLQPTETYPKVAMATQLQSAQQRAIIGRVPGTQTLPESHAQLFSTSQVVSYSTVQMPQRQLASTIELGGKYWDENTKSHLQRQRQINSPVSEYPPTPRTLPSPTMSDKREPPTPPQRSDSRNKTQQIPDHMKSSSWPVPITETQESRQNDNNSTPSSVISPTDIPPVKLCPEQDQPKPSHSKRYLKTGEPELANTYSSESRGSPTTGFPSHLSQGTRDALSSETYPGMNKAFNNPKYSYSATPYYIKPGFNDPGMDTNSDLQNMQENERTSFGYQPSRSPPTRDTVGKITKEEDPLVSAFEDYLQTVQDHEDKLVGVNVEDSSTGSDSPTHQPPAKTYSSPSTDYDKPFSQTLPAYVSRMESEKRSSRTSVSSLDSHSSSPHRGKSPTSRLSSDEEENNRKNRQLGNGNQRTWKNPNDMSNKAITDSEKQWQAYVQRTTDPAWGEKYSKNKSNASTNEEHVKAPEDINEKFIRENSPGIRSPISPVMIEAVTNVEPLKSEMSLDKLLKTEGRDSGYEPDNPYRPQQESPNPVRSATETFTSDDWMKLGNVETNGGTSILSQLQKGTPFSQRYINGDQTVKMTKRHKTKEETSNDVNGSFFGSQSHLTKQTGPNTSSHHYHSSSLDLDPKVTGTQAQTVISPWKPEESEDSNLGSSHSRSLSCSGGFYPNYPTTQSRFSRIDEEPSDSGNGSRFGSKHERRSVSGASLTRPRGFCETDVKDYRRSTSDLKSPDVLPRKSSLEHRGKYPKWDSDLTSQHQYSKSDSERHRKYAASEQCHKNSDPTCSGAIRKPHRTSGPENKHFIQSALYNFFQAKTGPTRSDDMFGSQQDSLHSDYASMYSSMNSLHHSQQSSYSSQVSHAHLDSGIVSPSESSWGPPSPNTSPTGVMDNRQYGQQRTADIHHRRTSSETTPSVEKIRVGGLPKSSLSMSEDYRPTRPVGRSLSMNHPRRWPPSHHDHEGFVGKVDSRPTCTSKGVSRNETFSQGQKPTSYHSKQVSQPSPAIPVTSLFDNHSRQHRASRDLSQQYPTKPVPSTDRSAQLSKPSDEVDVPPELPPKEVQSSSYKIMQAQLKTIAKMETRQPEDDGGYRNREQERKVSAPTVFDFLPPTHTDQQRTSSQKTSPTLPTKESSSPPSQTRTRPRTRTSPSLSPTKEISSSSPPIHQVSSGPRLRAESFDLPPPPTPPPVSALEEGVFADDLPPPPPEFLEDYICFTSEEKTLAEAPVFQRNREPSLSSSSSSSITAEQVVALVSPRTPSPRTSPHTSLRTSPHTNLGTSDRKLSTPTNPSLQARFSPPQTEANISPLLHEFTDHSSESSSEFIDIGSATQAEPHKARISPLTRRQAVDLEFDNEAGPIEVVEIIHTPTVSPKRGGSAPPGHQEEETSQGLLDWTLQTLNPQDFALRELFKFPDEPLKVGSLTYRKMPHGKKEDEETAKTSECDVTSLTHALSSSLYLQISPAKAFLLTRAKSMTGSEMMQGDSRELRKTKEELISRIARKVSELKKEKTQLEDELSSIEDLGRQVTENVRKSCKASSLDKYLMYVGDVDNITKLLLKLSRQLTKVNSVLSSLEDNEEEEQKPDLQKMHKDITGRYDDAKGLKVSIDARHGRISSMLQDHLSQEEYVDFCHFVPTRSQLRIMAQELDDRIMLGEEQLDALRESLRGERSEEEKSECSADDS